MRISINIPDELFKKAKITAARQGLTLRQFLLRGLQKSINEIILRPDADRLPKIPVGNRKPYHMSNEEIQALFADEEVGWYHFPLPENHT